MGRLAGVVALGFAFGCGGIWHESVASLFANRTAELERLVPETDPNREAVAEMLREGWLAAWTGEAGFFDTAMFGAAVEECTADGRITEAELARLRVEARDLPKAKLDADLRADLLVVMDGQVIEAANELAAEAPR